MIETHRIADDDFAALATGCGGPAVIRALWRGQRSKRLLLLRLLVQRWPAPTRERDHALAVLAGAESRAPTAVGDVLAQPMVGAWATSTLRLLRKGWPGRWPIRVELGHLGPIAAVAALRAGLDAELVGYARAGWLSLPAVGRLALDVSEGAAVQLSTRAGRLLVQGTEIDDTAPTWQPVRRLGVSRAAIPIDVALDDIDPYRDAYHVPAADRLSTAEVSRWRRLFVDTWRILTRHAPVRASELAAGLQSMVPLTKPDARAARSATVREAVGVVGLDLPASAADFAVALVHEFQHSKLTAVIDIVPLYDGSSTETFFAPWRADPRPVGGLFQGTYAFLGVADTWRSLSEDGIAFPEAERRFAEAREQVSVAVATLAGCGLLTPAGQRFVDGMAEAAADLREIPLTAQVTSAAKAALEHRREAWRRRNGRSG